MIGSQDGDNLLHILFLLWDDFYWYYHVPCKHKIWKSVVIFLHLLIQIHTAKNKKLSSCWDEKIDIMRMMTFIVY